MPCKCVLLVKLSWVDDGERENSPLKHHLLCTDFDSFFFSLSRFNHLQSCNHLMTNSCSYIPALALCESN